MRMARAAGCVKRSACGPAMPGDAEPRRLYYAAVSACDGSVFFFTRRNRDGCVLLLCAASMGMQGVASNAGDVGKNSPKIWAHLNLDSDRVHLQSGNLGEPLENIRKISIVYPRCSPPLANHGRACKRRPLGYSAGACMMGRAGARGVLPIVCMT